MIFDYVTSVLLFRFNKTIKLQFILQSFVSCYGDYFLILFGRAGRNEQDDSATFEKNKEMKPAAAATSWATLSD